MQYKFNINPIPKVRMTQASKWSKRAQECLQYQQDIANLCLVHKVPKYGKSLLAIKAKFVRNGRLCDYDNLIKSLLDGLQYGGIFDNDNQIRRSEIEVEYTKGKPYIELMLSLYEKEML